MNINDTDQKLAHYLHINDTVNQKILEYKYPNENKQKIDKECTRCCTVLESEPHSKSLKNIDEP